MKAECWVTLAESDGDGWAATVLARSIRKTLTTRNLTIAISENVSQAMKVLLQREFDTVVRFDSSEVGRKGNGILWLWNLRNWSKCVYVDPKSIMLKNSDELFSKSVFSASVNTNAKGICTNLFVFQPSLAEFEKLVEIGENVKDDSSTILNNRFKAVLSNPKRQISKSFCFNLKECGENTGIPVNTHIVTLDELPWKNNWKYKDERTAQGIVYTWVATFVHEVIPQLAHLKCEIQKEFLMKSLEEHQLPSTNGPATLKSEKFDDLGGLVDGIAVVGMSCRFPGANNTDEFWDLLVSGQDPIRHFPSDRPRPPHQQDEDEKNFEAGFLKCPVDEFDAKFFGISPREAPFVDPQQRLLLEVIWESLENANINPHGLKESKTGVFVGVWQQEYEKLFPDVGLSANEYHHRYLGNAFSATASRISHFLGLYGPNYAIESGCSSSSSGVHLACQSLRRGETTLAIASGVNLVLHFVNPLGGDDLGAVVLSNDFRCKTFDERADGFVRAEGCGAVVLKPLAAALGEGDNVLGVIRGTALNNDGPATSFGTPNAMAQERVFREALADAGVEPRDVSFVEAHGTGTVVGDPTEMYAIGQVYSEGRTEPLLVSSVKTNIGHAEACAGMAGLIKVLLCLQHKKVPPHLHLQKLNPRINLEDIPAKIPLEVTEWDAETRIAAVSSFSMSGTNVHIIVQETPPIFQRKRKLGMKMKPLQMIGISAKSDEALEVLCGNYISFLQSNPHLPLADVAHSLNTGRAKMPHRIGLVAKDTEQLLAKLEKRTYIIGKAPQQKQKIVFLFTGQGSQYFGMAKGLYEVSSVFQSSFSRCDALFRNYLSVSLKQVLWEDSSLLEKTIYCQPAIFSIQYCLVQLWNSFGIHPDFVIGHSVGEFCAAVCAGVLSLDDGMKLVVGRSMLVYSLEEGRMLAIKKSPMETRRLIKEFSNNVVNAWIDVAAENSLEEVVVSGNSESVQKFSDFCAERGVKTQSINASHAFHSRHMDVVLDEFGDLASEVIPGKQSCGYISGTLAREMKEGEFEKSYWQRHLRDSVRFQEAIQFAWESPRDGRILIEIGTQPILLSLAMGNVAECSAGTFCPSLRKSEDDLSSILNSLAKLFVAGVEICWEEWNQGANKVILPTYPFQRQKFWYSSELDEIPLPPILHPLLGRQLPAPVTDHIYTQILSTKNLSYVSDHRVAERVILPAAAYLESIMAAGCQVLQGGRVQIPFCVEELMVEAPLELTKSAQVQTIVRSVGGDQGVKFEIGIHKQVSNDEFDKWKRHAVATFSPSMQGTVTAPVDIKGLQEHMSATESISTAYEAVAKAGIQFGPKFQSISEAWKGENEVLTKINLPEDSPSYICHPIVLDAMIQTFAFRTALTSPSDKIELQLPISIKKFTWFSRSLTSLVYAFSTWTESGDQGTVTLFNENGEALATMEGLELLRTTVDSFLRVLSTDLALLPAFVEEVWKPTSGVTRSRVDPANFKLEISTFTEKTLEKVALTEDREKFSQKGSEELFFLYLLRAILECQWPWPGLGHFIKPADWVKVAPSELRIVKTETLLNLFENYGFVKKGVDGFQVTKDLPSLDKVEAEITAKESNVDAALGEDNVSILFTKRCGIHLTSVFQGKMTPIAYLFPSDANEVGAIRFYTETMHYRNINDCATSLLLDAVTPCAGTNSGTLRILEVGAGSGICCSLLMEGFAQLNLPFHYTFTDISPLFLHEAEKKFSKGVTFAVFNIEEDPLTQGFAPQEFDVIIASNVVHATQHIGETLRHLRLLLRPNGILVLGEMFINSCSLHLSFGILDGWWRFNDFRKDSPLLNQAQWVQCFEDAGFGDTATVQVSKNFGGAVIGRKGDDLKISTRITSNSLETKSLSKNWLFISDESPLELELERKMREAGRNVFRLRDDLINLEGILFLWTTPETPMRINQENTAKLLYLTQKLIAAYQEVKQKPKIFLVTRGVNYLGDAGAGNPNPSAGNAFLRTFANENPEFHVSVIDVDQDEVNLGREAEEVFASLWSKEKEMFKAVREDKIFVQRLIPTGKRKQPIPLPNSNRFVIVNPASKSINDLEIAVDAIRELKEDEVEVAVRATALNFRDIFMILQPEGFEIPDYMPREPGLDISGIISAIGPQSTKFNVGDPVFGFTACRGLASHVVTSERLLFRKPPEMTFPSAATIPVAFITVLYSFQELAKLRAGDRVLIHVATGGVGLAAIQMANYIGAEIYATAGSRRKRAYLRSIGIQHVYHSRNTAFGDEILRDTDGAGVTVVLNSLTGPNFKETSLRTCAQGARFVEIGKINIWSEEDVRTLRPDVAYFVVELAIKAHENPESLKGIAESLELEFHKKIYGGLPHDPFPLDLIREAFHYFQEAKHIGKIVINMPEAKLSPEGRITFHQNLFHAESTYLITGGLGGLGMEVAKWMCGKGAQNIILSGRSPANQRHHEIIQKLNVNGCRLTVIQVDVRERDECESLLKSIQTLGFPPLRGIMHAAGVLSDGIVANQTWEKFEAVLGAKVNGTFNLHQCTLGLDLEFFTLFSSVIGLIGLPGLCNHAAANRFMDSFAHFRWSMGLSTTTINFGAWSEVGAAAHLRASQEGVLGIRAFSPQQGLAGMEKIFRERCVQMGIFEVFDWAALKQIIRLGHYLDEMRSDKSNSANLIEAYKAIVEEIKNSSPEERQEKIEDFLEKVLKETLRIPENEQLDREQNFSEIGVDSLMAMELRNRLQGMLGEKQLTISALQENRTIRSLSAHMANLMNSDDSTPVDTLELMAQDSILPPDILATIRPAVKPSEFKEILLTGATGHLGVNFLPALQRENPNLIIHCIVRGKDTEEANVRLRKHLQLYSLQEKVNLKNIRVIPGDLSKDNFCLLPETYESLTESVDAIVHCAVKSNHLEEYNARGEGSLRAQNVTATVNVLRFATTNRTKAVFYASSLLAVTKANEDGTLCEEFPPEDDSGELIKNGYSLTKFVCEKLMAQAEESGIPITVIRYASIFGNSQTGFIPTGANHSWAILLSCIRVRKFPRFTHNGIPFMAVDTAANISAKIFLRNSSEWGVYNLTSSTVAAEEDIKAAFEKFGVEGDFVPFTEWRDLVFEEMDVDKNELGPYLSIYGENEEMQTQNYMLLHPLAKNIAALRINSMSAKVWRNCPEIESDIIPATLLLERHLKFHYDHITIEK